MTTQPIRNAAPRAPIYAGAAGRIARLVDAAVGLVSPGIAHRMRKARLQSQALLAYEAATFTRTFPVQTSGSADSELLPDLQKLRDVSRNMVRDDAHAAAALGILEEAIVGAGIRPQSSATPEATGLTAEACAAWRAACDAEWHRWAEQDADATRRGTFYDLQALALRCSIVDGEAIAHAVIGGDGLIACELIDADRLQSPGMVDRDRIRGGVELGNFGEAIAYHILPSHPDDTLLGARYTVQPVRIDAESNGITIMQHVFRRLRPGQTRGVPWLSASAQYLQHLHHYLNSELIAARAASNYAMFIRRNVSTVDQDIFPVQGSETGATQDYHEFLEPGTIEYLNEGEEPVAFTPNRPGSAFTPFVERMLRAIASSMGLSYEIVAKDFGRMNLSSARAMLRECQRGFDMHRARLNRQFNAPWWANVIRMAVASGRIAAPAGFLDDPQPFLAARWVAPSYGMVDPGSDVAAAKAACEANLSTPYEEAAKYGADAEQILLARARFLARAAEIEREFGLEPGTLTKESPERIESVSRQAAEDEQSPADIAEDETENADA
jgi:lambda family phage portal protein